MNPEFRAKEENRCGSGILHLERKEDLLIGKRHIILGLNIPDHPADQDAEKNPSKINDEPAAVTLSVTESFSNDDLTDKLALTTSGKTDAKKKPARPGRVTL